MNQNICKRRSKIKSKCKNKSKRINLKTNNKRQYKRRSKKKKGIFKGGGEKRTIDEETCSICKELFDDLDKFEVIICKRTIDNKVINHSLCSKCFNSYLNANVTPNCHLCRGALDPDASECILCNNTYNKDYKRTVVCESKHSTCLRCFNNRINNGIFTCPTCDDDMILPECSKCKTKSKRVVICESNHSMCLHCLNNRIDDDNLFCHSCNNYVLEKHVVMFRKKELAHLKGHKKEEMDEKLEKIHNTLQSDLEDVNEDYNTKLEKINSKLKTVSTDIQYLVNWLEGKKV